MVWAREEVTGPGLGSGGHETRLDSGYILKIRLIGFFFYFFNFLIFPLYSKGVRFFWFFFNFFL